jgi:hypothetical protein
MTQWSKAMQSFGRSCPFDESLRAPVSKDQGLGASGAILGAQQGTWATWAYPRSVTCAWLRPG